MNVFQTTTHNGRVYGRLSPRWVNIRTLYDITPHHSLWDYVTDGSGYRPHQDRFDPSSGTYCSVFRFHGQDIPTERFYSIGSLWVSGDPIPYTTTDGKTAYIGAVDMDGDLYNPLYLQLDEYGERVRVWKDIGAEEVYSL